LNRNAVQAIQWFVSNLLSSVTCRPFAAPDLRALYAVEEACFDPPLRFSRTLMRSLTHDPACRTWLGIVDNVRVGFAIVSLRSQNELPDTATDPGNAYIWTIEVLPAFRRMGVGRQLLMRVEESAREAGCAALELHVSVRNEDALALYESVGFVRAGVEPEFYGSGADGFLYRKLLQY
jgi:ribosomal protein S18 acetylase RimI-like enzyme